MRNGRVVFVGAGPGDPELISVKGLKAIQNADVILYDALVSEELLKSSPHSRHVFVGKRKGKKEFSQEEINQLLVFYARKYNVVVRLKGGDPNVFGRGHEEAIYLTTHHVQFEMINGISSAIAAPSAAGIPLTLRGVSQSFWVITGTMSDGSLSNDFYLAAQSSATVVVLMGISKISEIADIVAEHRGPREPMAVVFGATCENQEIIIATSSTIKTIMDVHQDAGLPGVIVIGKVVENRIAAGDFVQSSVKTLIK